MREFREFIDSKGGKLPISEPIPQSLISAIRYIYPRNANAKSINDIFEDNPEWGVFLVGDGGCYYSTKEDENKKKEKEKEEEEESEEAEENVKEEKLDKESSAVDKVRV